MIGAGVVGLAVARALALAGQAPLVIEREAGIGMITSSRNSEVIHAGIYYPPGSLKARLCIAGRDALYAYCRDRGVPFARTGKIIFAAGEEQVAALDAIRRNAIACGVGDLVELAAADIRRLEPALGVHAAILSPSTGIIDSRALMLALQGEAEANGAQVAFQTAVARIERRNGLWQVWIEGEDEPVVETPILVNAAGHDAPVLAGRLAELARAHVPARYFARGCYFTYTGRTPFSHLIYPIPEPGGLGVHLTLDLAGQARFGPNVQWVEGLEYAVPADLKGQFVTAARRIWPELEADRLQPGYSGIRPKISGPGEPAADFRIDGPAVHGLPGLVNLFGIESPGLTASLAIADRVVAELA